MEELLGKKIRKRGSPSIASTSTTSSSLVNQHGTYKFKRAILVGKQLGSSTPMVGSRSPSLIILRPPASSSSSPRYPPSLSGRSNSGQTAVSARKLGATLWEMNEIPRREKMVKTLQYSLPPHTPTSHQNTDESCGIGSNRRKESSMSSTATKTNMENYDSCSNATFMETESRSRCQTPSVSASVDIKTRLKDVSNAITTSKELLRIISRVWGRDDQPSPSISLVSALHCELERARLKINHLILEDNHSEEKAVWKNKEQELVETIAGELQAERKLRKQFQSLNKKLGKELAETKQGFHESSMKKLEREDQGSTDDDNDGNSSDQSELHSIDVSTQNEELKGRKSFANQVARGSCENEKPRAKGSSRLDMERELVSPFSRRGSPWPSQGPRHNGEEAKRTMSNMEQGVAKGYNSLRRSRR